MLFFLILQRKTTKTHVVHAMHATWNNNPEETLQLPTNFQRPKSNSCKMLYFYRIIYFSPKRIYSSPERCGMIGNEDYFSKK